MMGKQRANIRSWAKETLTKIAQLNSARHGGGVSAAIAAAHGARELEGSEAKIEPED